MLLDRLNRPLRVLRISLTDRCNLRCNFCMPPDKNYSFLKRNELMSSEEIEGIVKTFVKLGVRKIRLTGGEPLLRKDLEEIIERVVKIEGIEDVALTTNGVFLKKRLRELKEAGLKRITVSIHSLNPKKNRLIVNRDVDLYEVLEAIEEARDMGFKVKVNSVIIRGYNDEEIIKLANYFKGKKITLRFIEYMDVGTVNDWSYKKVVSADEILARLSKKFHFYQLPQKPEDTALRFRYKDDNVEFGIIASVTKPFCKGCDRIRLSADGKIFTCLFSDKGYKLPKKGNLEEFIKEIWENREDRYSELRNKIYRKRKVEMFKVGG